MGSIFGSLYSQGTLRVVTILPWLPGSGALRDRWTNEEGISKLEGSGQMYGKSGVEKRNLLNPRLEVSVPWHSYIL